MKLRQWALRQTDMYKKFMKNKRFSKTIGLCSAYTGGIHVFRGIEELALAVGEDIAIREMEKYFVFNGVEFFQLLECEES